MTLPDWAIIALTAANVTAVIYQVWIHREIKRIQAERIELNRQIMQRLQEARDRYGD